jgi:hypothetical protein
LLALVLAVAAAFWVVPALQRRAAVIAISKNVYVGYGARSVPNWLVDGLSAYGLEDNTFTDVKSINARSTLTDADLATVVSFPELKFLDLSTTQVTDAGMIHLQNMKMLQTLDLSGTQITDAGLAHLPYLQSLEELGLEKTKISDAGLVEIAKIKGLKLLRLRGTAVTNSGLDNFKKSTPHTNVWGPSDIK